MSEATTPETSLYDADYLAWVTEQVSRLQARDLEHLDIKHLIEELEGMGKSDRRALSGNLRILLAHLLKWQYQPQRRSGSWLSSIKEHRRRITEALEDSPRLKSALLTGLENCYEDARDLAATETELPPETFPLVCPFVVEELLNIDFLPAETSP